MGGNEIFAEVVRHGVVQSAVERQSPLVVELSASLTDRPSTPVEPAILEREVDDIKGHVGFSNWDDPVWSD
jgi:hypothetical protein